MKSIIRKSEKVKHAYPVLKHEISNDENKGMVVLFSRENTGMVVRVPLGSGYSIGDWADAWNEQEFELFEDEVVLSNL